MPLWKLQTVGSEPLEFLYENVGRGNRITLKPGVAYCFRAFYELIRDLIEGAWVRFVQKVNGNKLGAGGSETCKATSDGTMTLKSELLTGEFHLTATTIETTGCKIIQVGSGATAELAGSIEKLSFGGLSIDAPVGCKVNTPISTNAVTAHLVTPVAGVARLTFNPTASTTGTFANITIKECAAAETYPLKGQVCAEMPQAGSLAIEQTMKFSEAADNACSTDKLTLGGKPAILRGGAILEMTGANSGKAWGFTAT
jgi:hypothetical protein